MSLQPIRRPFAALNQQPIERPQLDRSNEFASGLLLSAFISHADLTTPINYVGAPPACNRVQAAPNVAFNSIDALNIDGFNRPMLRGAYFNGTSAWCRFPLDLSPFLQITISFWTYNISTAGAIVLEYGPNFSPNGFQVNPNVQLGDWGCQVDSNGTAQRSFNINHNFSANTWNHHVIAIDRTSALAVAFWQVNGQTAALSATGSIATNVPWVANGALNVGARNAGASFFAEFRIAALHVWNYAMSARNAQRLFFNAWQMYRAQPIPTFAGVGTLKAFNTLPRANIKTLEGVAIGGLKSYGGLTTQ